nr:HAD family phosphatase [Oscillospiraceae bacterium]
MRAVLLDFNGTMFFDSSLHSEAWSKIYQELHPEETGPLNTALICGPCNEAILKKIAPWLSAQEREWYSQRKEALYRQACISKPENLHLVAGTEDFLQMLQDKGIPFGLASASIRENIDFFFETFSLGKWFRREDVVYDDGTYPDKGAMHLEAARRLSVRFADCLVIEDSPTSIRLARQNGAGRIVAVGATADPAALKSLGADYYITDFSQFDCAWLYR